MKQSFLCGLKRKHEPFFTIESSTGSFFSFRKLLPAAISVYFINLYNSTFMTLLTITAKKLTAGKNLLLACLFLLFTVSVSAQEKTVSGVVKNPEDGSPIANATVQIKGTKIGTITDEKGSFNLKASDNQTLVISAIGFTPM